MKCRDALCAEAHVCLISTTTGADQGMMEIQFQWCLLIFRLNLFDGPLKIGYFLYHILYFRRPDWAYGNVGFLICFDEGPQILLLDTHLDTQFNSFDVNYVARSCNNCAHELARYGLSWTQINPFYG